VDKRLERTIIRINTGKISSRRRERTVCEQPQCSQHPGRVRQTHMDWLRLTEHAPIAPGIDQATGHAVQPQGFDRQVHGITLGNAAQVDTARPPPSHAVSCEHLEVTPGRFTRLDTPRLSSAPDIHGQSRQKAMAYEKLTDRHIEHAATRRTYSPGKPKDAMRM